MNKRSLRALARHIVALLNVSNYHTTTKSLAAFHPLATASQLAATGDHELLSALYDFALLLEAPVHTADKLTLLNSAAIQPASVLLALHSRRDWIMKNPDLFQPFHHFLVMLYPAFPGEDQETELLDLAETLALAYHQISDYDYPEESHLHGTAALKNVPYLILLIEHADHITELLQYRWERKMDRTPVMEPHHEENFQQYVAQGPVKSGWL